MGFIKTRRQTFPKPYNLKSCNNRREGDDQGTLGESFRVGGGGRAT